MTTKRGYPLPHERHSARTCARNPYVESIGLQESPDDL